MTRPHKNRLSAARFQLLLPNSPGGIVLFEGIASRNIAVLHMLFDSYAPSLYGQILGVVKDPACAVNVLEKTLLYSVKHIHEHNSHVRLHSWMLQIANFKILEEAAIAVVGKNLPEDLPWDCYGEAWNRLQGIEKEVLEGSAFKAVRHEEMAIQLEMPLETLQLRISTGLCHFHALLSSLAA